MGVCPLAVTTLAAVASTLAAQEHESSAEIIAMK